MSAGSFDAGSVLGHLGLDISEYGKGILEAQGYNELFPESISAFIENPLLGAVDIAKESAEAIADAVKDSIMEITELGTQISLSAEKAGTSVEFMSHWSEIAKSVEVPIEELSMGFKFLQKNAEDAADGNATAMKGFEELGISVDFLKSHLGDTQGLFEAVRQGMQSLPNAAARAKAGMDVLGRTGSDLVPIFDLSNQAVNEMMDTQDKLGATFSSSDAEMARGMSELHDIWGQFTTGLEKDIAIPIFDFILAHKDQITTGLEEISNFFENTVGVALNKILNDGPGLQNMVDEVGHSLAIAGAVIEDALDGVKWLMDHGSTISSILNLFDLPLQALNAISGGASSNAFNGGGGSSTNNFEFNLNNAQADEKTAQMVAGQTRQALQQAADKRRKEMAAQTHGNLVRGIIGGI